MTIPNNYDVGAVVRVTATFTTASAAVDPTTVKALVKDPAGTVTTYTYGAGTTVKRSATGVYYIDVDVTTSGEWKVRFKSTGTGKASADISFYGNAEEVEE